MLFKGNSSKDSFSASIHKTYFNLMFNNHILSSPMIYHLNALKVATENTVTFTNGKVGLVKSLSVQFEFLVPGRLVT